LVGLIRHAETLISLQWHVLVLALRLALYTLFGKARSNPQNKHSRTLMVKTDTIWQPTLQRQFGVIMYGGSCVVLLICSNMQWWDCSSLMSSPLAAEEGCETSYRVVLLCVFVT